MVEYNSFPKDMQEICEIATWSDFFCFCIEKYESRNAYKNDLREMSEKLRIAWIKKEQNLGFCIGMKGEFVKFYRIGTDEAWRKFKCGFAAQFRGDNS